MPSLKNLSDRFSFLDNLHHLNKLSLVIAVFIFAAIPVTVFGIVTLRRVDPKAATNPYIADNLISSASGSCIADPTRPGMYQANVNFSWNPAAYAIASDIQYLDLGTDINFISGTYYGSSVTNQTRITIKVNKEQTLYWRINTHYTNGVWAPTAGFRVNNNCAVPADTTPPTVPPNLMKVLPSTTKANEVDLAWGNSCGSG